MAFVDELTLTCQAGRGGDGVVRWLHAKGKEKGGPSGGDGGRGGDVVLRGVRDLGVLASHRFTKVFQGDAGEPGGSNDKHGADGKSIYITVPVGTIAENKTTKETVEILHEHEEIVVLKGGVGGFGNAHFKGSTNQNPFQVTKGRKGEEAIFHLSLKLIADAGFIGFPNAGKSSLLNALTNARSRVGAYPFTTLEPHLGDFYGFILADIPGIISGASGGKGLGFKFLKHIERTRNIVHLVSSEQDDVISSYKAIRAELAAFGKGMSEKNEIIVLTKVDIETKEVSLQKKALLEKETGKPVFTVSILDDELLKEFSDTLHRILVEEK